MIKCFRSTGFISCASRTATSPEDSFAYAKHVERRRFTAIHAICAADRGDFGVGTPTFYFIWRANQRGIHGLRWGDEETDRHCPVEVLTWTSFQTSKPRGRSQHKNAQKQQHIARLGKYLVTYYVYLLWALGWATARGGQLPPDTISLADVATQSMCDVWGCPCASRCLENLWTRSVEKKNLTPEPPPADGRDIKSFEL